MSFRLVVTEWSSKQFLLSTFLSTGGFKVTGSAVCLSSFCLGVSVLLTFKTLLPVYLLFIMSVVAVLLSLIWLHWRPLGFLLLGMFWATLSFNSHIKGGFPQSLEGIDFSLQGQVEGLVNQSSGDTHFNFRILELNAQLPKHLEGKKLKLSCYRCPYTVKQNQVWRFTVRVKRPYGYASWGAFDYEKFLFANKVVAKGYVRSKSENTLLQDQVGPAFTWRNTLRQSLTNKVADSVGLNMILALTVGDKSGFTSAQRQVFQTTGTSHLMAISGLHVGLVFVSVGSIFGFIFWPVARIYERWPKPILTMFPALASAVIYSALAGFAVSTQRALIMLCIYVVCRLLARDVSLIKVLLIAMAALLIVDPFSIMDIGFWLSVSAVLVIGVISHVNSNKEIEIEIAPEMGLNKSGNLDSNRPQKTSLIKLQPMLWLGMLPITVGFFGQVSLLSPLVNLILVPLFCLVLVPVTLVGVCIDVAGLVTLSSWWFTQLSYVFDQIYRVLEWLSALSYAKMFVSGLRWWQWGLFALALLSYLNRVRFNRSIWLIFVITVFLNTSPRVPKDELHIALLDVGQGLAMVIESANRVMVYDTGPKYSSGFSAADAVLLPYLTSRGIRRIDTLVISHADNDHIGGYETLTNAFEVSNVLTSRVDKIPVAKECRAGDAWDMDDTFILVLSPQANTPTGSNNHSCVLMLEHLDTKVLLSGDIEKQVERFLLQNHRAKLAAQILLVPHQGSKTSSTAEFLDVVAPEIAMVAAGYRNNYGHPHESVVQRYNARDIDFFSTVSSGSILLKINADGWRIVEYRKANQRFWHTQKVPNS